MLLNPFHWYSTIWHCKILHLTTETRARAIIPYKPTKLFPDKWQQCTWVQTFLTEPCKMEILLFSHQNRINSNLPCYIYFFSNIFFVCLLSLWEYFWNRTLTKGFSHWGIHINHSGQFTESSRYNLCSFSRKATHLGKTY